MCWWCLYLFVWKLEQHLVEGWVVEKWNGGRCFSKYEWCHHPSEEEFCVSKLSLENFAVVYEQLCQHPEGSWNWWV